MHAIVRLFMAMVLAILLIIMTYAGLWLLALNYAGNSIKSAVGDVLGAQLTYGAPTWQPAFNVVAMRLPMPVLTFTGGPVQKVEAPNMVLEVGFFVRDRFRLRLPATVNVTMAGGNMLTLQTVNGEVVYTAFDNTLSLRAKTAQLTQSNGQSVLAVDDVMLSRSLAESGVRINLASRPVWNGAPAQLSGQLMLPQPAVVDLLTALSAPVLPSFGQVAGAVVRTLQTGGGTAVLENISFRQNGVGAGFNGQVQVGANGRVSGRLMVTADNAVVLKTWLDKAGLGTWEAPATSNLKVNWARVYKSLESGVPAAQFETPRGDLMLNGILVSQAPVLAGVVARLWP